jgi:hypothetical protein
MPVNSIVVAACLEWMQRHVPESPMPAMELGIALPAAPRWATIRRAVEVAVGGRKTLPFYPLEQFTATAQVMLTAAQGEAQKSGFNYIGTEHLLLAAFAQPTSHSAVVLESLGVDEQATRATIDKVLQRHPAPANPRIVPTSRVKKVIEIAFKLCGAAGAPRVSTAHILLALATEGQGIAAHVLKDAGITSDRLETAIDELPDPEA